MASNLSCIGFPDIREEADFVAIADRVFPESELLVSHDGVEVRRWQDESGARLVFGVRGDQLVEFLPSFAAAPGVRITHLSALNDEVISADVIDQDGEQTTSIAFELEQRRRLDDRSTWTGLASLVALAPDVEFFADEDAFAASRRSLMDPDAEPDEPVPPGIAQQGIPWPLRVAPESFISYGGFGEPAEARAYGRLSGRILDAAPKRNALTGEPFLACRVACIGFELQVLAEFPDAGPPSPGGIVSAQAFFAMSIDELPARQRSRRRLFGQPQS